MVESWTDPHVTYRTNPKQGRFPWRPNQEKAAWRNLNDLFDLSHAPQTVRQYTKITSKKYLQLRLYGVQTNQGSYLASACHDMRLPVCLLDDEEVIDLMINVIESSELLASALGKVLQAPDIPSQTVSQAVQSFYDRCEHALWNLCDTLEQQGTQADLRALYSTHLDLLLKEARDVLSRTLQSVQLRGRSLIEITNEEWRLYDTIKKRKEVARL